MDTLLNIFPVLYEAIAKFPRRQFGILRAVQINAGLERAAIGQEIIWDLPRINTPVDVEPSCVLPCPPADTAGSKNFKMEQSRAIRIAVTGEANLALGSSMKTRRANQYLQAMDVLAAEIETYLVIKAIAGASRAYGTAGTTPFQDPTDMSYFANMYRILLENNRNSGNLAMILNGKSSTMLRSKMSNIWKANEFGDTSLIQDGILTMIEGFAIHEINNMPLHVKGTGAAYVTNGATAQGVADVALVVGAGTVLAGDVVTFAADTDNKYVVNAGIAAPGIISLGEPGARMIIPTGNAMTIGANYQPNVAFNSDAIGLAVRPPAVPAEGDAAIDSFIIQDPVTGLPFEIRRYAEYRQIVDEVSIAWGGKVFDPAGIVLGLS
jgi:hypothetical protein